MTQERDWTRSAPPGWYDSPYCNEVPPHPEQDLRSLSFGNVLGGDVVVTDADREASKLLAAWRRAVANQYTLLGYKEWVAAGFH